MANLKACVECGYNNNGWCKKLSTNKAFEKECCVYNSLQRKPLLTKEKELHEYMPNTLNVQAIEEMAELQQAITKIVRNEGQLTEGNKANLIEEIADVEIMIEALKGRYNVSAIEVENNKKFKIERMKNRFKNGEYM